MSSLSAAISTVLLTGDPRGKVMATRALVRDWRRGQFDGDFSTPLPDRPAVPPGLQLLPPNRMPKRGRGQSERGRIALWHALAHIEFVAIDLALDMAGRFGRDRGAAFIDDFLSVAADEALHFAMIDRKLRQLGSHYGALPAHNGLWDAAFETRGDVAARLAVVPMVLEARGLDVTPATLARVRSAGDEHGARILQRILDDEIRHVAVGTKYFLQVCEERDNLPELYWRILVARHFRGAIKPPFNDSARLAAGLSRDFYAAIA